MARGPITSPESMANIRNGIRRRDEVLRDKRELADAVVEAVREEGPTAAARAVQAFARERPSSSVVRLMFPEPGEDE